MSKGIDDKVRVPEDSPSIDNHAAGSAGKHIRCVDDVAMNNRVRRKLDYCLMPCLICKPCSGRVYELVLIHFAVQSCIVSSDPICPIGQKTR